MGINLLFLLDRVHVDFPKVLGFIQKFVKGVGWVYWLICLCRVFAGPFQYNRFSARMLFFERSNIVCSPMNDNPVPVQILAGVEGLEKKADGKRPAVLVIVMLGDFIATPLLLLG